MTMLRGVVLACALVSMASAHPLGNVGTNRWTALTVTPEAIEVRYVVDLAELPALREIMTMDRDGDGDTTAEERDVWAAAQATAIAPRLVLALDGRPLPLATTAYAATLPPGAAGMRTLRLELDYVAPLPALTGTVTFRDEAFAGRPGWQEVVARARTGASLREATVPSDDLSEALRRYPSDRLDTPPRVDSARFTLARGPGDTPAATSHAADPRPIGDRFAALVTDPTPLGPAALATALLVAAALGALHALAPGHGKTIVGAYLIGSRGTAWHAAFLGLVVTATHTIGVYALGLATLAASTWVMPERLLPWLSVVSGLLVVAVGARLLAARWGVAHHHHHGPGGHTHAPPTRATLLALGVSGGLVPCPSALIVMLGAIAAGRTAFGLILVLAFSAGLAAVLTAVGVVLVHARGLFDRLPLDGRLARLAPVASAAVISLAGIAVVVEALRRMGGS